MARFLHYHLPDLWRKGAWFFLAFSWLSGLICGICAFSCAGNSAFSVMRGAFSGSVSIVGLLGVTVLPFLFSAFAVFISKPGLLLVASFGKAFLASYVSLAVMLAFGSAGWLIRWLLCFSSCAAAPLLYWYWLRYISGERKFSGFEVFLLISLLIFIGSLDYCVILPFLAGLIN